VIAVAAAVLSLCACSGPDDEPAEAAPADARAVCTDLQAMVDALDAGRSVLAVQALDRLEASTAASSDEVLRENGRRFFSTINDTVPDPGSLTPAQAGEIGDRALAATEPAMGAIIDRCAELGLTIRNLPTSR
jgi:hypothetical protein